jgi:hypothetical protein
VGLLFYLQTGTKMKKNTKILQVTLLLTILGLLSSCHGKATYARWELLNNSNHSINVITYLNSDTLKTISLPTKGTTWESENFQVSGTPTLPPIFVELGNGDSTVALFNDDRYASYVSEISYNKFNIYDKLNYSVISATDIQEIHRYTFTNDDYENATLRP